MSIYHSTPAPQDHGIRRLVLGSLVGVLSTVLLTCIAAMLFTLQILPITACKLTAAVLLFIASSVTAFTASAGCTKKLLYGACASGLLSLALTVCNLLFAVEPLHLFSLLIRGISVIAGACLGVSLSAWIC